MFSFSVKKSSFCLTNIKISDNSKFKQLIIIIIIIIINT